MNFLVISFYAFTPLKNIFALVEEWKGFFSTLDAKGRIYLSDQGINAQLSLAKEQLDLLTSWLEKKDFLKEIFIKTQPSHQHAFEKMIIKYREQLVAIDQEVDFSLKGNYMSPSDWKKTLEGEEAYLLIDVRNDYEYKIGHFKGAVDPGLKSFREFPDYLERLKKKIGKDHKILMCCTGGIRCEIFSSMMIKEGFEDVNQLEGGMIAYGNEYGAQNFEGKLFVFDDRMAVDLDPRGKTEVISTCFFCETPSDTYYNCANMDCNDLFLACPACYETKKGCCHSNCESAARVRKIAGSDNTPFRKWYHYFSSHPAHLLSR